MTEEKKYNTVLKKIGTMVEKISKNGKKYFRATIDSIKLDSGDILIFENNYKRSEKDPDYIIYEKTEEED